MDSERHPTYFFGLLLFTFMFQRFFNYIGDLMYFVTYILDMILFTGIVFFFN